MTFFLILIRVTYPALSELLYSIKGSSPSMVNLFSPSRRMPKVQRGNGTTSVARNHKQGTHRVEEGVQEAGAPSLSLYVCESNLSVGTDMYMQVPEEAREGARSPGVEVTGDHEIPDMDDGKKNSRSLEEQTLFQSQTGCSL